jgi:hypothetical protein
MKRKTGVCLQRLFSTFANGFPGIGLLLQRVVTAAALGCFVYARLHATSHTPAALLWIDAGAALLLLGGLWTPVAGAVVAGCELWIIVIGGGEFWLPLVLATLGATLAIIGPGALSIDALLFGRKQIRPLAR